MAWSKTDTGVKAGNKEHMTLPTNFSTTASINDLEREQWNVARQAAEMIVKSGAVGKGVGQGFTITLSGTATAGHPVSDTITVTVTNSG